MDQEWGLECFGELWKIKQVREAIIRTYEMTSMLRV